MSEDFVEIVDRHGRRRRAKKGEVLADGERMVVSMVFQDAALRDALTEKYRKDAAPYVIDTTGGLAGHRPGFLFDPRTALADSPGDIAYRERLYAMARRRRQPDDDGHEDDDGGAAGPRQETELERRQRPRTPINVLACAIPTRSAVDE